MTAIDKSAIIRRLYIAWMLEDVQPDDQRPDRHSLATADAIARAAHLWIRSVCNRFDTEQAERQAVAGGLVAGLCDRLELDPGVTGLVAYIYALLDDMGNQALSISRLMLDNPQASRQRAAYIKGKEEAAAIVEMLACHRQN